MWPALAAWGAGLIHLAVGASAPPFALVVLVIIGAAEIVWGVLALRTDVLLAPRGTLIGAVVAVAASVTFALTGTMGWLPLASSTVFLVFLAGASALALRGQARAAAKTGIPATEPMARRPGRTIVGLAVGAAIVAALTTPALAATEVGEKAVPHGEMPGHHAH